MFCATSKTKDEELANNIEDYLPLVKAIIRMENGDQPYEDDEIIEGMYKAGRTPYFMKKKYSKQPVTTLSLDEKDYFKN